jgi:hypothetical protein
VFRLARTISVGSISEFLIDKPVKKIPLYQKFVTIPLALSPFNTGHAFANEYEYQKGDMTKEVGIMFEPIADLLVAAGLPFAGIMFAVAAYHFMLAKFDKGLKLIYGTAIGYLILNLIAFGLKLLTTVSRITG